MTFDRVNSMVSISLSLVRFQFGLMGNSSDHPGGRHGCDLDYGFLREFQEDVVSMVGMPSRDELAS